MFLGLLLTVGLASGQWGDGAFAPDEDLSAEIDKRLHESPALTAAQISVSVQDGEVTFEGTVGLLRDAWAAEDLAAAVSGVTAVDNELQVQANVSDDTRLGDTIKQRLDAGGLAAVQIDVFEGAATLSGDIGHAAQRLQARELVAAIPGVVSIDDQLAPPRLPDDQVQGAVTGLAIIGRFAIDVSVVDGQVSLDGSVPLLSDKRRIEREVLSTGGTQSVDNQITVGP